jgi:hypothetical protein
MIVEFNFFFQKLKKVLIQNYSSEVYSCYYDKKKCGFDFQSKQSLSEHLKRLHKVNFKFNINKPIKILIASNKTSYFLTIENSLSVDIF